MSLFTQRLRILGRFSSLILALALGSSVFAEEVFEGSPNLETVEDQTAVVVIRSVNVVAQGGTDQTVNLRIENGVLDIISKDPIPTKDRDIIVEASGGFLLGRLVMNEPPSFIIVDDDPRENVEAILDTKSHTVLALHQGEIIRNRLAVAVEVERPDPAPTVTSTVNRWFAYTPPPVALPLTWDQGAKWNHWDTDAWLGVFTAALVLDRQNWLSQNAASESQVGDLGDFDGGEVRGFRFGVVGALKFEDPWLYTIFAATNAFSKGFEQDRDIDDITMFDYRLDIPTIADTTFSIGRQKETISQERITGGVFLPFTERSAVSDAMMPSRNIGVAWSGTGFEDRTTWALGAFNNWYEDNLNFSDAASQLTGRFTATPLFTQDESTLLHLGIGFRYSDAKEGMRFRTEPEFNKSPLFVDTGFMPADSVMTWNLEGGLRYGPYMLNAEYTQSNLDSPTIGDPTFNGYFITGSWVVTGEMHGYNRKNGTFRQFPIAKSTRNGGYGSLELVARWTDLDLTDASIAGGDLQVKSVGVNWWLSEIFQVSLYYRHTTLDRYGVKGSADGIMSRLLLMLD